MLERMREGLQGPWAMVVVALIVLSFVFTGVGSYLGGTTSDAVAKVNDVEISETQLDTAYQNERARMEAQFGEAISAMFSNPETLAEFRSSVLDRLIADELIQQKADSLGLRVSDESIKQTIVDMPEFQIMGQFDNDTYLAQLRQAGFQPSAFRDYMRAQMTASQLRQALTGSAFALDKEVSDLLALQEQKRDLAYVEINASDFADQVTVSDADIEEYYQANIDGFDTPEQVKLAYVSLDVESLMKDESVEQSEIENYYTQQLDRYKTEEQRRVSHILIEFGDDEEAAQQAINEVASLVKAENADFAALAEEYSQDIVSAEEGGDLDFLTRGQMGESFDDAVFAIEQVGDVSDVVRTDFGFHLIKLTDKIDSVTTPLAELKDEIEADLLREKALNTFYGLQEQMAALAFEVPDTLEDVANAIGATVMETTFFQAQQLPAAVAYPQIEGIAFSDELVFERVNSELLQINDDKVMVVRVADHKPARTLQLDEVREGIVAQLTRDKQQEAATTWAQSVQAELLAEGNADEALEQKSLQWTAVESVQRSNNELDQAIIEAGFRLAPSETGNTDVVNLMNGNVALVKLNAVHASQAPEQQAIDAMKQRMAVTTSRTSFTNLIEALKAEAEVSLLN